jgi:carboxymethylenebutenolidase
MSLDAEVTREFVTFPNGRVNVNALLVRPRDLDECPGVVVVPENIGLTEHRQKESAELAAEGFAVLAINPYTRHGGKPPAGPFASEDERRRANFLAMPDEQIVGDIIAGGEWLGEQPGVGAVGILGFCSGGSQAFVAAATHPGAFTCLVTIYGNVVLPGELTPDYQPVSRLRHARALQCPFQGHYGVKDHVVPIDDVEALEQELDRYQRDAEVFRYEGAGHVFADPGHPNHHPQATSELWPRVHGFLKQRLAEQSASAGAVA